MSHVPHVVVAAWLVCLDLTLPYRADVPRAAVWPRPRLYQPQQGFEPKFFTPAAAKKAQFYLQCCFLTEHVYVPLMLYP